MWNSGRWTLVGVVLLMAFAPAAVGVHLEAPWTAIDRSLVSSEILSSSVSGEPFAFPAGVTPANPPGTPPASPESILTGENKLLSLGTEPTGTVYDSGKREVFVANVGSNNVSVVTDGTIKVIATVS